MSSEQLACILSGLFLAKIATNYIRGCLVRAKVKVFE
jgi:hypothetical protein